MSDVRFFTVGDDDTPQAATLDEALLHEDAIMRMSPRLHATGALETVTAWINDELQRAPSAEGMTSIIRALTLTHMQIVASIIAHAAPGDQSLAKALARAQAEIADLVIPAHYANVCKVAAAEGGRS